MDCSRKILIDALGMALPLLLPQNILLQFARARLWQLLDNHNTGGTLESGHIFLTEPNQLLPCHHLVRCKTRLENNKGLGGFSPSWMGDCDDGDLKDSGVLRDAGFHF